MEKWESSYSFIIMEDTFDKSFYEDVADSLDLVLEAVSRSAHSDSYASFVVWVLALSICFAQLFVERF